MIKYKYWSNIYKLWQQVSHDELVMIQAYSWIAVRGYNENDNHTLKINDLSMITIEL